MNSPDGTYSGHSQSFDVGIAKNLGIKSAVIFNIMQATPTCNISREYIYHCVIGYMTVKEAESSIFSLIESGLVIENENNGRLYVKEGDQE